MAPYFIGVDIGTAGTKAAIVDTDGNVLATAYEESKLYYPKVGWVEQEPDDFVISSINTIKEALRKAKINPNDVVSLAFSGQMAGILAIDKNWNPVIRYDSWLDIRCKEYVNYLSEHYADMLIEVCGVPPTINHLPKMMWWRDNEPETFNKIYKFTVPAVYAAGKFAGLKGEDAFYDYTYATFTGIFDIRRMEWSQEIANALNLPLDKLPRIVKPWEIIGELTQEIAEKCGLVKGIPIAAGAGDYIASCLGAGLTRPGLCIDVAGTASILSVSTDKIAPDKEYKTLLYVKSVVPELWQVGSYINGGGLCLRWFRDEIGKYEKEKAKEANVDPYKLLDEEASKVPEGSEGLIFIPHLGGRAYPNQPDIKGVWLGFTWKHTSGHFFRSIMEGIAYEYYYYFRIAKSLFKDLKFQEIRGIGGGSKSRIWAQIKADVLNMPYVLLNKEEYAALALAAIGGYAVGALKDYKQAIERWVKPVVKIEPRPEKHEKYRRYAEFYEKLLNSTSDIFKEHAKLL